MFLQCEEQYSEHFLFFKLLQVKVKRLSVPSLTSLPMLLFVTNEYCNSSPKESENTVTLQASLMESLCEADVYKRMR